MAVVVSIAALTGCGEDRSNLVPDAAAKQIDSDLERVKQLVKDGDCFEALDVAEGVRDEVEALGSDVDETLRLNLLDGVTRLQIKVQDNCEEADGEPTAVTTAPDAPADDTDTSQNTTSPVNQGPTDTAAPQEPEPTSPPAPAPTPTPTPPNNGSGGVSPPSSGGVAPPSGGN